MKLEKQVEEKANAIKNLQRYAQVVRKVRGPKLDSALKMYIFLDFQSSCRYKSCHKISAEEREKLFIEFWNRGDYNVQNFNLLQGIKIVSKKSFENSITQ